MPEISEQNKSWLNRTVLGVGLTSLLSDWSHEAATAILPAFLAFIGAGPAWLGAIEGISDGLSRFHQACRGPLHGSLKKRKPIAVFGYAITALATASFAVCDARVPGDGGPCRRLARTRCPLARKEGAVDRGHACLGVRARVWT